MQFEVSFRTSVLCAVRNLGEPREASRSLRRNNRAFGSLPYQNCTATARCRPACDTEDRVVTFVPHSSGPFRFPLFSFTLFVDIRCAFFWRILQPGLPSHRARDKFKQEGIMNNFVSKLWANLLWSNEEGQDIAEYSVMLAVILVIVVGTIRLIGSNAGNVFSQVGSAIQ
jgi:Flp pilus assembly pilin Flp